MVLIKITKMFVENAYHVLNLPLFADLTSSWNSFCALRDKLIKKCGQSQFTTLGYKTILTTAYKIIFTKKQEYDRILEYIQYRLSLGLSLSLDNIDDNLDLEHFEMLKTFNNELQLVPFTYALKEKFYVFWTEEPQYLHNLVTLTPWLHSIEILNIIKYAYQNFNYQEQQRLYRSNDDQVYKKTYMMILGKRIKREGKWIPIKVEKKRDTKLLIKIGIGIAQQQSQARQIYFHSQNPETITERQDFDYKKLQIKEDDSIQSLIQIDTTSRWKGYKIRVISHSFLNDIEAIERLMLKFQYIYRGDKVQQELLYSKVIEQANEDQQQYIYQYLADNLPLLYAKLDLKTSGARLTLSELQRAQSQCTLLDIGTGYYNYQSEVNEGFHPELVNFSNNWFIGWQEQKFNDCLIHSLNYACGGPWFQCREQVVRFLNHQEKQSKQTTLIYKANNGIKFSSLKKVVADPEGNIYSLLEIYQWKRSDQSKTCTGLLKHLQSQPEQVFILGIKLLEGINLQRHALTIKKTQDQRFAFYDSCQDIIQYSQSQINTAQFNIQKFLLQVSQLRVFILKKDEFKSKQQRLKALATLKRIMSNENDKYQVQTHLLSKKTKKKRGSHWKKKSKRKNHQVDESQ